MALRVGLVSKICRSGEEGGRREKERGGGMLSGKTKCHCPHMAVRGNGRMKEKDEAEGK